MRGLEDLSSKVKGHWKTMRMGGRYAKWKIIQMAILPGMWDIRVFTIGNYAFWESSNLKSLLLRFQWLPLVKDHFLFVVDFYQFLFQTQLLKLENMPLPTVLAWRQSPFGTILNILITLFQEEQL